MLRRLRSLLRPIVRRLRGMAPRPQTAEGPQEHELAIVVLVSDEVHNQMRAVQMDVRDRFGDGSGLRVPPHISLKQGFLTTDVAPFEKYFDALVQEIEPFDVQVRGIKSFDEWVLFVDVVPDPRLESLRQRILHDLGERFAIPPGPYEGPQFHFHATLAYSLPKPNLTAAADMFASRPFEATFPMDTLGLFIQAGDGWTTLKQARLTKLQRRTAGNEGAAA